ncbi:MAG TPA: methyltransferase domain-containing protein [Candidatus Nitrosotenuis sp.]|nr:methyltransferase domain-containing protein [Candidatus Nitrosotenuis sp.]
MAEGYRRPWFGPLGELAWHSSLALYEMAVLGRHPWWWRLHRSLARHFRGLDPEGLARAAQGPAPESLAYGETPAVSLGRILTVSGLGPGARLVDLGSGRGLAVCTACCLGWQAVGLEYFEEYVRRARRVAADLGVEAEFVAGDFLSAPLPQGDLFYAASTAFGQATRARLGRRLAEELPPGTLLATLDWVLEPPAFEGLARFYIPVTWGVACVGLYRRAGLSPGCRREGGPDHSTVRSTGASRSSRSGL